MSKRKPPTHGAGSDLGALARRRGRNVLMLSELVLDFDNEGMPTRSPSDDSSSSLGATSKNSKRCTPCTPQMTSFSPPKQRSVAFAASGLPDLPELAPRMQQVAGHTILHTSPMQKAADASQRCPAGAPRLGGAAAGPCDASQRKPVLASPLGGVTAAGGPGDASQRAPQGGRLSLGVAVLGGDASQRTPQSGMHVTAEHASQSRFGILPAAMAQPMHLSSPMQHTSPLRKNSPMQHDSTGNWIADNIIPLQPCDASRPNPSGITGTCPTPSSADASRSPVQDASQRGPAGGLQDASKRSSAGRPFQSNSTVLTADGCSDVLKSWLSGASSHGCADNGSDLAERLRAALPESYED